MMTEAAVLQLRTDHMRETLHHAIMLHESEISGKITEAVDKAIERFDFTEEIASQVAKQLDQNIEWAVRSLLSRVNVEDLVREAIVRSLDQTKG